jgi:hypothetical protein
MENLKEVANYVLANLSHTGYSADHYSVSTSCGDSVYIYAYNANNNLWKFRISNHGCGQYRIETEICLQTLLDAEIFLFPDRFLHKQKEKPDHYRTCAISEANLDENCEILSTRISKKGNTVYNVRKPIFSYHYVRI